MDNTPRRRRRPSLRIPLDADKLTRRRLELGLTQSQLAARAEVSDVSISLYERGVSIPRPGTLARLASALNTTPAALLLKQRAARSRPAPEPSPFPGETESEFAGVLAEHHAAPSDAA